MRLRLDGIEIIIAKTKKKIRRTAIITIIVIVLIVASLAALDFANKNKIAHGLQIAGIPVGGLTINEARIKLEKPIDEFLKKDIVLRYKKDNEIWTANPGEMGIKINIDSTLNQISKMGHQKRFFSDTGQQILAFFGYYNLPLNHEINEVEFEKFIREKLNSIDKPAVNAALIYSKEKKDFISTEAQEGKIIDRENLKLQLHKKIDKLTKKDVFLTLIDDRPEILENETKDAHINAKEILALAPYKLIINDPLKIAPPQIHLTKEELISLIEFNPIKDKNNPENKILGISLNGEKLNNYLIALSHSINRAPIDAQLILEGNKVTNFSLSRGGLKLEIEKNVAKINEEILNQEKKDLELEISIIPPKIVTKNIDNLGITSLIAKGSSNFSGSPKNRIHNIGVGAVKFNGVLIKPNEEFSFNTILGEVGPETGYKAELVIKQNKTIPEYGGGLCQVSTTAFRAAVYAGLPIRERQAHAFPVKYYNPQGFDATIYPPHPDLRFVNNTPGYLLIQTKIQGSELTFEFYGTDDGRKVEVEEPYQYDIKLDGSMRARLIRRIYDKDGNLVIESIFNSNYKSPNLYPVERNPLE